MSRVYGNYSRALCEVIRSEVELQNGSGAAFLDDLRNKIEAFIQIVESNPDLKQVLVSPIISKAEKESVVSTLSDKMQLPLMLKNTFKKLAQKNRFTHISEFLTAFDGVRAEQDGKFLGEITSASKMNDTDVEEISKAFEKKLSKKIIFQLKTDPNLIGGIKVKVGGVTYDKTIQTQLKRLRELVLENI